MEKAPIVGNPNLPTDFSLTIPLTLPSIRTDVELRFMAPADHKVRLDGWYLLQQEALDAFWHRACERFMGTTEIVSDEAGLITLDGTQFESKAGLRLGTTLQTRGQSGPLCYGPYIRMEKGVWQVALVGLVGPNGLGGAYADVCIGLGAQVVHAQPLCVTPFNQQTDLISPPWCLTLSQDVEDIDSGLGHAGVSNQSCRSIAPPGYALTF